MTRSMSRFAHFLLLNLLVASRVLSAAEPTSAGSEVLRRIAFGSCAKQDKPQPIWDAVVEMKPQLFIFLGDNIYGDTMDMAVLKQKWNQLDTQPGYELLKKTCPVIGTWDDHDYGANDAGVEYPMKRESQQLFLDFLRVPADHPRRRQEGVYDAPVFGPPGRRVQVILLDARYHRSPLKKGFQPGEPGDGYRGPYAPNEDPQATVLGDAQWKWLAAQLKVPAELRLICSGVQVLPTEHGSESWGNFPLQRKKLFELIRDSQAKGVVLLSGDRHLAEIMRLPADEFGISYPITEVTSSSLNAPSGNMTRAGVRFANEINRYRVGLTYFDVNFGGIEIDWDQTPPLARVQVRDEKGGVVLQQKIRLE